MRRFAICEGSLRKSSLSLRSLRQPETTSCPRPSSARSRAMSAGSFWRSPSMGTMAPPRAASMAADMAAVCPKLRRKRSTRSAGSRSVNAASAAKVPSELPSSTQTTSNRRPSARRTGKSSARSGSTFASSLKSGMTTDSSGGGPSEETAASLSMRDLLPPQGGPDEGHGGHQHERGEDGGHLPQHGVPAEGAQRTVDGEDERAISHDGGPRAQGDRRP